MSGGVPSSERSRRLRSSSSRVPRPRASPSSRKRRQTRVPRYTHMHRAALRSTPPRWLPLRCRKIFRTFPRTRRGRTVQSVRAAAGPAPRPGRAGRSRRSNHVVRILPGHTVTIDDTSAVAYTIAVDGKLAFAPSRQYPAEGDEPPGHGRRDGHGHARRPGSGHRRRADRRRRDGRDRHRQFAARRQRRRPGAVRHRAHRSSAR